MGVEPARVRAVVGKVLLASAVLMLGVAGAVWTGMIPLDAGIRPYVTVAFGLAGAVDGVLGLRFLGEPGA